MVGIAGHGDDLKRVGRLAFRSIVYFEVVTTLALVVGLVAVNLFQARRRRGLSTATADQGNQFASSQVTFAGVIEHTVPAELLRRGGEQRSPADRVLRDHLRRRAGAGEAAAKDIMLGFCESLAEVMFKYTGLVMLFAPIGIGAAIAVTVGHSGIGVLRNLSSLVVTLYGALIVFVLLVLVPVALLARIPLRRFWRSRSLADRLLDRVVRSRAAAGASRTWRSSGCRGASCRS